MKEQFLPAEPIDILGKEKLVVFRAEGKVITKYLLLLTIFLFAISLLTLTDQNNIIWFVLAVVGYYMANIFFTKRPVEIVLDLESRLLTIKTSQLVIINSTASYPLELITYSYKLEVRAKGIKRKVFRLFNKDKRIADILPEYSGWSEKAVTELHQLLCDNIPANEVKHFV